MEYCYIEFTSDDCSKIKKLNDIIEVMKEDKVNGTNDIDNKWVKLFADDELDKFWWPNQEQFEETKNRWGDVFIKVVQHNINKQEDWDIYSMFEAIMNSEYELIGIRMINNKIGRLEFNPEGYPYGGTQSLQKLIKSIGIDVIAVDDGTGRELI